MSAENLNFGGNYALPTTFITLINEVTEKYTLDHFIFTVACSDDDSLADNAAHTEPAERLVPSISRVAHQSLQSSTRLLQQ